MLLSNKKYHGGQIENIEICEFRAQAPSLVATFCSDKGTVIIFYKVIRRKFDPCLKQRIAQRQYKFASKCCKDSLSDANFYMTQKAKPLLEYLCGVF